MPRFHLPKAKNKPKNYSVLPWTEEYRCKYPAEKVFEMMKKQDIPIEKLVNHLHFHCGFDRDKAVLLKETIENQINIVRNDQEVNIVVNLPFCCFRCFNCNNVMYDKQKNQDVYPYFFDALVKEIIAVNEIVKRKFYMVRNICFTGNLLALEPEKIEKLLRLLNYSFCEKIVEVGSPSFVTEQKLEILSKHNITRIVINSLTFNTVSLRKLCRRFEFKDLYEAYKKIVAFGFETSFEMVVGLLDEKELQLTRNLEMACELGASNIDLYANHCKSISEIDVLNKAQICEKRELLDLANKTMLEHGYKPYFLYTSETQNGCFENVGWTVPDCANKFYKDKYEVISTILGCGTQVENVLVKNIGNKRTFLKNPYDISLYIFGIDEIIEKKNKFFE